MNFSLFQKICKDDVKFRACILSLIFGGLIVSVSIHLFSVFCLFFISYILSLLLNPAVTSLGQKKIPRSIGAGILILLVLVALATALGVLSFFVHKYFLLYGTQVEDIIGFLSNKVWNCIASVADRFHLSLDMNSEKVREYLMGSLGTIMQVFLRYSLSLFDRAKGIVESFSALFIIAILSFYFLKDWPNVCKSVRKYIPRRTMAFIDFVAPDIKTSFKKEIGGQVRVSLVMMSIYSFFLFLLKVKGCFLLGLLSGLLTFIPYLGVIIAFLLVLFISMGQGLSLYSILAVGVLYFLGSSLESNFLTPKWIGHEIGLHPLWIFFAVLTSLSLFGFVGGLIVMPLATFLSSFFRNTKVWLEKETQPGQPEQTS